MKLKTTAEIREQLRTVAIDPATTAVASIDSANDLLYLYDDSGDLVGTVTVAAVAGGGGGATITALVNEVIVGDGAGNGIGRDEFTIDSNGDVTIQNTVDSTTAFQILDADGGTPILNIDTTNERVGIGTDSPVRVFHTVADRNTAVWRFQSTETGTALSIGIEFGNSNGGTWDRHLIMQVIDGDWRLNNEQLGGAYLVNVSGKNWYFGTATQKKWKFQVSQFSGVASQSLLIEPEIDDADVVFRNLANDTLLHIQGADTRIATNNVILGDTVDLATTLPTPGTNACAISGKDVNGNAVPHAIDEADSNVHLVPQIQTLTLGAGVTTFEVTAGTVKLTGDAGGNTIATVTLPAHGWLPIDGVIRIIHQDGLVTWTDTAATTPDTIDHAGGLAPAAQYTVLEILWDGNKWYQCGGSVN